MNGIIYYYKYDFYNVYILNITYFSADSIHHTKIIPYYIMYFSVIDLLFRYLYLQPVLIWHCA